ncbi:riboflavin synthase [Acidiferrobacter sp.]|uniref:riboflavin synthase n=1 Tax=Acidiferrobacter sp. TaxID=1872107 RepID=UPI00260225D0|nr:riboflavin synthase [Acidiferrobacter sp.]
MFTGLIQSRGTVVHRTLRATGARLAVDAPGLAAHGWTLGESIAVNGVCLTLVEGSASEFCADLSAETLARTALSSLRPGYFVNLERALKVGDALGGHLVSGHVDGVATVLRLERDGEGRRLVLEIPQALTRYVARKGSLCVDGVSLTVNTIEGAIVNFAIVPHTLSATTLGELAPGALVNIEVDLIARYLERLLPGFTGQP